MVTKQYTRAIKHPATLPMFPNGNCATLKLYIQMKTTDNENKTRNQFSNIQFFGLREQVSVVLTVPP